MPSLNPIEKLEVMVTDGGIMLAIFLAALAKSGQIEEAVRERLKIGDSASLKIW